jgi:hypothetical protein
MVSKIFENEFVKCELDDSLPVLKHRWKFELPGNQFKDQVQAVLTEYSVLKNRYPALAWLADTTNLGELDDATEEWLVTEWEDLLFRRAGVKIHAVILGASIFADYPMEKFKMDAEQKFKDGVRLGVFSNEKEAYDWIKQNL